MSGLKATEQDRLYLSGAIHRMGERTGSAAERILDDLDTLLAENAKLAEDYRAVLAGACTSAARAGARDASLRRLEAENARLLAVAEAAREYRAMEAPGLDMCRDNARDVLDAALAALEAP